MSNTNSVSNDREHFGKQQRPYLNWGVNTVSASSVLLIALIGVSFATGAIPLLAAILIPVSIVVAVFATLEVMSSRDGAIDRHLWCCDDPGYSDSQIRSGIRSVMICSLNEDNRESMRFMENSTAIDHEPRTYYDQWIRGANLTARVKNTVKFCAENIGNGNLGALQDALVDVVMPEIAEAIVDQAGDSAQNKRSAKVIEGVAQSGNQAVMEKLYTEIVVQVAAIPGAQSPHEWLSDQSSQLESAFSKLETRVREGDKDIQAAVGEERESDNHVDEVKDANKSVTSSDASDEFAQDHEDDGVELTELNVKTSPSSDGSKHEHDENGNTLA